MLRRLAFLPSPLGYGFLFVCCFVMLVVFFFIGYFVVNIFIIGKSPQFYLFMRTSKSFKKLDYTLAVSLRKGT